MKWEKNENLKKKKEKFYLNLNSLFITEWENNLNL